ncbi:MAG: ribosome biogenesis GTP-binding protein YsxC [Myxococcales bacterium]|nr:ribosome biogenesis GTP-binding protein YsxC [Myxococcales bacterium]
MTASPKARPLPRITDARFVAGATHESQLPPPTGVEIAFAGRSNVGKSSLMNHLMGRRNLVRTSSTPGCTRQISFFEVAFTDESLVTLVDLPGYGYARRSKTERAQWAGLIEGYLLGRPTLSVVCLLVDFRRGLEADDEDLLKMLAEQPRVARPELQTLVVATKLDKVAQAQRKPAMAKVGKAAGRKVLPFSIKDQQMADELWRELRRRTGLFLPAEPNAAPPL